MNCPNAKSNKDCPDYIEGYCARYNWQSVEEMLLNNQINYKCEVNG